MKKQNGLAVRSDFRFAIAEHARALSSERVAGGADVRHFVADVMDAAVGILLQELRDGRVFAERLQQFDLRVGKCDEHSRDPMLRLRDLRRHLGAQGVAINHGRLGDIADGDGDVVETTDHDCPRIRQLHHTVNTCTWHIGFLPQRWATAARTPRRSASATDSGSRLRPRGSDSNVSMRASCTTSPLSVMAIATDTAPAKLNRLRSATVRASASTNSIPSL